MLRGDREVDAAFLPGHKLYFRIAPEDVIDGVLIQARIRVKDQSVNWSKYSFPWDVIFDHPGQGIARLRVSDLPSKLPEKINVKNKEKFHGYFAQHVPEKLNYAHSEIRVKRGEDVLADDQKVTMDQVKKLYRAIIAMSAVILLVPTN